MGMSTHVVGIKEPTEEFQNWRQTCFGPAPRDPKESP